MSLGLPTLRPRDVATTQDNTQTTGEYQVIKQMSAGLVSSVKDQNHSSVHPLQHTEKNWLDQREKIEYMTARNMQGLHMPMKLSMERFAAKQIGRLPCMATRSSNLMHDTLTGRDEMIDADDVFNCPTEFPERSGNIHAIMEKRQGVF